MKPDAPLDVIRSEYRALITKYHPDRCHTDDAALFLQIQEAWEEAKQLKGNA